MVCLRICWFNWKVLRIVLLLFVVVMLSWYRNIMCCCVSFLVWLLLSCLVISLRWILVWKMKWLFLLCWKLILVICNWCSKLCVGCYWVLGCCLLVWLFGLMCYWYLCWWCGLLILLWFFLVISVSIWSNSLLFWKLRVVCSLWCCWFWLLVMILSRSMWCVFLRNGSWVRRRLMMVFCCWWWRMIVFCVSRLVMVWKGLLLMFRLDGLLVSGLCCSFVRVIFMVEFRLVWIVWCNWLMLRRIWKVLLLVFLLMFCWWFLRLCCCGFCCYWLMRVRCMIVFCWSWKRRVVWVDSFGVIWFILVFMWWFCLLWFYLDVCCCCSGCGGVVLVVFCFVVWWLLVWFGCWVWVCGRMLIVWWMIVLVYWCWFCLFMFCFCFLVKCWWLFLVLFLIVVVVVGEVVVVVVVFFVVVVVLVVVVVFLDVGDEKFEVCVLGFFYWLVMVFVDVGSFCCYLVNDWVMCFVRCIFRVFWLVFGCGWCSGCVYGWEFGNCCWFVGVVFCFLVIGLVCFWVCSCFVLSCLVGCVCCCWYLF